MHVCHANLTRIGFIKIFPLRIANYFFVSGWVFGQTRQGRIDAGSVFFEFEFVHGFTQDRRRSRSQIDELDVHDALDALHTVLFCIVLYFIVLYCIVLHCIVLYCIVLYCIVLYCIVLYCIVSDLLYFRYPQYCIVLYEILFELKHPQCYIVFEYTAARIVSFPETMFP